MAEFVVVHDCQFDRLVNWTRSGQAAMRPEALVAMANKMSRLCLALSGSPVLSERRVRWMEPVAGCRMEGHQLVPLAGTPVHILDTDMMPG